MKKIFTGIATIVVLGAGGLFVAAEINDKDDAIDNTTNKEVEANAANTTNEVIQEVQNVPTERTADITEPWQGDNGLIKKFQSEGKIVFLYSDADKVEQRQLDVAGVDPNAKEFKESPNNYTKDKMAVTTAENLGLYIKEVSQLVDNQPYFDKLKEVQEAMTNGQYDAVSNLITEARSLRESE